MRLHFIPAFPPAPQPAPPKPLPTPLATEQAARELIETAERERTRRTNRRKMLGNRKRAVWEKVETDLDTPDDETSPKDGGIDVLA
jgi:hypothetical protein